MNPEKKDTPIISSAENEYASSPCYLNSPELRPEYKEEYFSNEKEMKPKKKVKADHYNDQTEEY
jgi:hypothetical protein